MHILSVRQTAFALLAAAVAVTLAAASAACSDSSDARATPSAQPQNTAAAAPTAFVPSGENAPVGPVTFKVLGGKADGAIDIEAFMPSDIHLREGDSIEWTLHGIEGHTVTFASQAKMTEIFKSYLQPDPADPGQQIFNPEFALRSDGDTVSMATVTTGPFLNSGFMGVPAEQTYKLTFTERGVYQYLCLVHPFTMRGTVSVDAPDAAVASPDVVAARGAADLAHYTDVSKAEKEEVASRQRELPGPQGTSVYRVATGLTTDYGQVAVFSPATLNIKTGDTVIFEGDDRDFHNVVFKGSLAEPPAGVKVYADPDGRGINVALDKASADAVDPPPGGFDPSTFLSSGSLGITMPRLTWRLTFDKPGTYVYNCTIHVLAGMAGVINVKAR
jgi:plastocyanin